MVGLRREGLAGMSFNGRTREFGSRYCGSNPHVPTMVRRAKNCICNFWLAHHGPEQVSEANGTGFMAQPAVYLNEVNGAQPQKNVYDALRRNLQRVPE